jgi:hypothetical protein
MAAVPGREREGGGRAGTRDGTRGGSGGFLRRRSSAAVNVFDCNGAGPLRIMRNA